MKTPIQPSRRHASWTGKILLALLIPTFLFGVLEGSLRVLKIGYPASLFIPAKVEGEAVWVENPFVTYSVFPPPLARAPGPIRVRKAKPADVVRVVVLGESAAQGDPVPAFGPSRHLEVWLSRDYPEKRVEVINAAITAINSHVIRAISRQLHKLEPDVVIVYMGNNEVIGPFGPATVFSGYLQSDVMIRILGAVGRTRTGQLLRWISSVATEGKGQDTFEGVSMFMNNPVSLHDTRLDKVRARFRSNVMAVTKAARRAGADVLLCTVAVNVSDCPPALSVHRDDLTSSERAAWQNVYERGLAAARVGSWSRALREWDQAYRIDGGHAELNYWMGLAHQHLGNPAEAAVAFTKAMDLDAFRYRTDSQFNEIIRSVADSKGSGVLFCDVQEGFRASGKSDQELFVDHVHFSFPGTALLARLWAEALHGTRWFPEHERRGNGPGLEDLAAALMFTPSAEAEIVQRMLGRFQQPPFDRQYGIETRTLALQQRLRQLNAVVREGRGESDVLAYRARLREAPGDVYFPLHLANTLLSFQQFREAQEVIAEQVLRAPHRRGPRSILALLQAIDGFPVQAADTLLGWRSRHGYFAYAETEYLIRALLPAGYLEEALAVMRAIVPNVRRMDYRWRLEREVERLERVAALLGEAKISVEAGDYTRAEQLLGSLLKTRGDITEAMVLMAAVQHRKGMTQRGQPVMQRALQRMPFARAYYHGAIWFAATGEHDQAATYLGEAAAIAHDDLPLVNSLAWIAIAHPREELREVNLALSILERAIRRRDGDVPAYLMMTYAAALAVHGDREPALVFAEDAIVRADREGNAALVGEIEYLRGRMERGETMTWSRNNRPMNAILIP
ncbi:MAG TPA: hypothetical protein PKE55_06680 [Kiritimatiellia bacterium]|nr:hypothetical protein [Kiritimatiellia bacterium]